MCVMMCACFERMLLSMYIHIYIYMYISTCNIDLPYYSEEPGSPIPIALYQACTLHPTGPTRIG